MAMSSNGIVDNRASADMDDGEADGPDARTLSMLDAMGSSLFVAAADDQGDQDGADDDQGDPDDQGDQAEVFDAAQITSWVDVIATDANPGTRINDVPEEIRGAVGNAASARINAGQRFRQDGYNQGLGAGVRYAELRELYENDRETFDALKEDERDLYHQIDKGVRDAAAARTPEARASQAATTQQQERDTEIDSAAQELLAGVKETHPAVLENILKQWDVEYANARDELGRPLSKFGALQKLSGDVRVLIAAADKATAEQDSAGNDSNGTSASAQRRQTAAAKRDGLARPDIGGGQGGDGNGDRFAAVDLSKPDSGSNLLETALAEGYRK